MKRKLFFSIFLIFVISLQAFAQNNEDSQPRLNPILQKAKTVLGLNSLKKAILHYYYNQVTLGREQSDRTYPPFFTTSVTAEAWLNTELNTTFVKSKYIGVGYGT